MTLERGLDQVIDDALVRDLAREVLKKTAPAELALLRPASERYFADPEGALRERRREQEVLGFGSEAVIALLTPVVLTIVTDVLKDLAADLARSAGTRGTAAVRTALRRLFGLDASGAAAEVPPITQEQLVLVRQSAFDRAVALDLPEAKANLLADALVGDLLTSD
jgi:hypothetical protein